MAVPDSVSDEAAAQVHCGTGCTNGGALSSANNSCQNLGTRLVSCRAVTLAPRLQRCLLLLCASADVQLLMV